MKTKSAQTYERILEQGLDIVSVSGLSGVTFGLLADGVGMSKSGLFAHFRSKEEIQLRLMERAGVLVQAQVVEPAMRAKPGLPRLILLMKNWLGWAARAGLPGGCPMAAAMFELDDLAGEIRAGVLEAESRFRAVLAGLVREAIDSGALRDGTDVDQFVWEMGGIYLSHHVSTRFVRDPTADRRAQTAFEALIDRARVQRGA